MTGQSVIHGSRLHHAPWEPISRFERLTSARSHYRPPMAASSDPKLKPLPGIFNSRLPAIVAGAESLGVAGTSPATTRQGTHYSGAGAIFTTSWLGPVFGDGLAQWIWPRRLGAAVAALDSGMGMRSSSLGALRGDCHT